MSQFDRKKSVCYLLYLLNDSGSSVHTIENFNIIAANHNYAFQIFKKSSEIFQIYGFTSALKLQGNIFYDKSKEHLTNQLQIQANRHNCWPSQLV